MTTKAPKKPLLDGLSGKYELENEVRTNLNFSPGILVCAARSWSDVDVLIQDYFESLHTLPIDSNELLSELQNTFTKLGKCKNVKVKNYANNLKLYYSNTNITRRFHAVYADKKLVFDAKKAENQAIIQGDIAAGALAVEGGIRLVKNSKRRLDAEEKEGGQSNKRQPQETDTSAENPRAFERVPSDLTDDYHPRRKEPYFFDISDNESISNRDYQNHVGWLVDSNIDITHLCYEFKENTLRLSNRPEQLSDTRLLALHDIYLFDPRNQAKSVGKYWSLSVYKCAVDDILYPIPPHGQYSPSWCTHLSLKRYNDWIGGLSDCAQYLVEATNSNNIIDIHCMQAAVQLVPLFISSPLSYTLEDTYVHNWISPLLKPIFSCEPLLTIEWANKHITQNHKPDFIASVKGINSWLPIIVGEFKRPGYTSSIETDLVKVGKELRTMINSLVSVGVDNPSVGAILIQGRVITTFKMDVIAPKCYRLIALATMTMFDSLSDISILPTIVSRLVQIKEISLETARKVQVLDSERAAHMMSPSLSPQTAWLSKSSFVLRKVTPTSNSSTDNSA